MDWLNKITITCFAASYLVVLGLEISRVFFNVRFRRVILVGFAIAGLFAHTVYLFAQGLLDIQSNGIWLSNWTAWCLTAAWLFSAAYLWFSLRKHESVVGVFLMPVLIALVIAGVVLYEAPEFMLHEARTGWSLIHGYSLLLGTVSVALGFVFGLVYLIQANRLKRKLPQSPMFRLPSLEWLQTCCERCLYISLGLLALGFVSGIAINLMSQGEQGNEIKVAWTNPVVWSSAILFAWLLVITILNSLYRPTQPGRKVAYLMVCCFLFLVFELAIVWIAGHAEQTAQSTGLVSQLDALRTIVVSTDLSDFPRSEV